MTKTIRLIAPDWQAGDNHVYYFGSQLLNWLAPENPDQKEVTVPIIDPAKTTTKLTKENGVTAQSAVKQNVTMALDAINEENPDKIITLGGNCLVSQAPFSYLKEKYGDNVGIIWLDAHPDISDPSFFQNEHAMVLANLIGKGDPELAQLVKKPFSPEDILYVGLQEPTADEKVILPKLGIDYSIENNQQVDIEKIQKWIDQHNFEQIVIHFDIDVLDSNLFFDQYFSKPGVQNYGVSGGVLAPDKAIKILADLSKNNDVVGLTIAEYLPWSALKLKELMRKVDIFN